MAGDTPALDAVMGVVRLLGDHWDAIDADFRRFYGLDLDAACFGEDQIGLRRLRGLLAALPSESALARSMGWAWDDTREMTATLVELVHDQASSTRVVANALLGKKKWSGPQKPLRWPRPTLPTPAVSPAPPTPSRPLDRAAIRSMLIRR